MGLTAIKIVEFKLKKIQRDELHLVFDVSDNSQ